MGHRVGSGLGWMRRAGGRAALLLLLGCQVQFDRLALICEGRRPITRAVAPLPRSQVIKTFVKLFI